MTPVTGVGTCHTSYYPAGGDNMPPFTSILKEAMKDFTAPMPRVIALSIALLCCTAHAEDEIITDRPDFVESSDVVGRGKMQIETSISMESNTSSPCLERACRAPIRSRASRERPSCRMTVSSIVAMSCARTLNCDLRSALFRITQKSISL